MQIALDAITDALHRKRKLSGEMDAAKSFP